jgi:hypothetical protein
VFGGEEHFDGVAKVAEAFFLGDLGVASFAVFVDLLSGDCESGGGFRGGAGRRVFGCRAVVFVRVQDVGGRRIAEVLHQRGEGLATSIRTKVSSVCGALTAFCETVTGRYEGLRAADLHPTRIDETLFASFSCSWGPVACSLSIRAGSC